MFAVLLAFVISLTLALTLVPALSVVAQRVGLVDHPDNKRKLHKSAIPMVGGLALFIAVTFAAATVPQLQTLWESSFQSMNQSINRWMPSSLQGGMLRVGTADIKGLLGLFLGALIILLVGIADDRFGVRGRQKLAGQILAATVLILFGYRFQSVTVARITIEFGIFSVFVIYAWVLASINSVNLLDGADGVASTIGIVMSLAMTVMMVAQGKMFDAVIAAAIAGGLFGFLNYNFPPARAYLGDAGSMLIGFLLAALAIRCSFKQHSAYAFFAPTALLAIPFIDTLAAIVRRRLTGRSIFAVDRGHLHHALAKRGYSPQASLLWVALLCSTTATGGTLSLIFRQSEYALASIGIVLFSMVFFQIFGVGEMRLVHRRATSAARSVMRKRASDRPDVLQSMVHVQGERDWESVWGQFCLFSDDFQLNHLILDVNAPWLHESFHAKRRRSDLKGEVNHEWWSSVPLIANDRLFGKVEISSSPASEFSHHEIIAALMVVVEQVECDVAEADGPIGRGQADKGSAGGNTANLDLEFDEGVANT